MRTARRARSGSSPRARRRLLALVFLSGVLAAPHAAIADDEPAPLDARLFARGGLAHAAFSVTSAFTESFRKRLGGGLTSRVLLELALLDAAGAVIASAERGCELRLDVWDDVVHVRVREGAELQTLKFPLIDDALKTCGSVEGAPLGDLALLVRPGDYRLEVRVALNPISPELLERTREFMSNPRGARGGRTRALFGAVARLFRAEAERGGEAFVFRSASLARPTQELRR
jgi:hypothetical protein